MVLRLNALNKCYSYYLVIELCWKMRCICITVMLLNFVEYIHSEYRQAGAVVEVCNHKYMMDCFTITKRIKRGEPYTTNYTVTAKYEIGNNVTVMATLHADGYGEVLLVKQKVCDMVHVEWLSKYLSTYSNMDVKRCPIPGGKYEFINLTFPPKGMPERIPSFFKGKLCLQITLLVTKTQEVVSKTRGYLYT